MSKTLEENLEEVKTLVTGIQSEFDSKSQTYGEGIATNDTSIKAMEVKFGELSEQIQTMRDEKKALEGEVKDFGLALARKSGAAEGSDQEAAMSDEVKSMFGKAIREKAGTYAIDTAVAEEIVTEHVKKTFGHLTANRQDVAVKQIMAEGSSPAGGMWCPVPVDSRIRTRVFETSPMRQLASVMNVNTSAMKFALDDEEILIEQAQEVDVRKNTDSVEFGEVRIDTHELYAKPTATLQLLEDSTMNLEAWLAGKVASKITRAQNQAFILGDGEKTARGILDYADTGVETYARGKVGTKQAAGSLVIVGDDLIDLQSHLLEDYQMNATWMMHRLIWAKVVKLKDENGQYLLDPLMLFNGSTPKLLGQEVRMAGDMPKPTSVGALVAGTNYVCYGDFREAYTILDRIGINVIMDNITRSGFVQWFFRTRYGGGVTNFQAYKRLQAKA